MHHLMRNTLIALIMIGFVVFGSYFIWHSTGRSNLKSPVSTSKLQTVAQAQQKETSAVTLKGDKKIIMKTVTGEGGITKYSFSINGNSAFYAQTLTSDSSMNLTYNSWSPDDKQVYIWVNKAGVKDAYVFNISGENFPDGSAYLSVQNSFSKQKITYKFKEATGWAGYGLLMVQTLNADGTAGPNFWFEIPSGNLIQLVR